MTIVVHGLGGLKIFVKYSTLDLLAVVQTNFAPLHHVYQTARCGHEQVTASFQIPNLLAYISTSINDARTHFGAVGELHTTQM